MSSKYINFGNLYYLSAERNKKKMKLLPSLDLHDVNTKYMNIFYFYFLNYDESQATASLGILNDLVMLVKFELEIF